MENFYLIPEYKKAFIGTTLAKPSNQTVAVYDFEKCIKTLVSECRGLDPLFHRIAAY